MVKSVEHLSNQSSVFRCGRFGAFFLIVIFFSLVFTKVIIILRLFFELGAVGHACNHSTQEDRLKDHRFRTMLGYIDPVSTPPPKTLAFDKPFIVSVLHQV